MSAVNFDLNNNTVLQAINHAYQQSSAVFPLTSASVSEYQDMFTPSESSPKLLCEVENAHSLKDGDSINDHQDVNGIHYDGGAGHMITNNGNVRPPYQLADNMNQIIQIPYYFETNSSANPFEIYSRDGILQNSSSLYDQSQEYHNNSSGSSNMIFQTLQNHSEAQNVKEIESQSQQVSRTSPSKSNMHGSPTCQFDQNSWQQNPQHQVNECNEMYPHHLALTNIYGSVLESPFPTPNLVTMETMQTTLSVSAPSSYPLISLGEAPGFSLAFNARRPQNFMSYEPDYLQQARANISQQTTRISSPSPIGNQKPPVYTKWTEEEDELLRAAISIYGPHKWSLIAAHVPNRTPMQCSTRWLGALNPTIHKGRWTPEEDAALKDAVGEFVDLFDAEGHPQPIPWNKIASRIPHRTGIQCQARWSEALDPSVRKGKWSPDEDEILKEGVRRFGRCWIRIAELIEGRTQRQCRTRWVQIKNKQIKLERDAMAAKAAASNSSTDEDSNDEGVIMLTPPNTTPSTPAQTIMNAPTSSVMSGMLHSAPMPSIARLNARPVSRRQASTMSSVISNQQSPVLSPTDTLATSPESCVTTPECVSSSPIFESASNHNVVKPSDHENMIVFTHNPYSYLHA